MSHRNITLGDPRNASKDVLTESGLLTAQSKTHSPNFAQMSLWLPVLARGYHIPDTFEIFSDSTRPCITPWTLSLPPGRACGGQCGLGSTAQTPPSPVRVRVRVRDLPGDGDRTPVPDLPEPGTGPRPRIEDSLLSTVAW